MYGHIDFVINIEKIRITVIIVYPLGKASAFLKRFQSNFMEA